MLQVAKERVIDGAKMKNLENISRDELIKELYKFEDFRAVKAKIFELIKDLNIELYGEPRVTVEFLPKFHCELSEIELWWRNSKNTFRKENDRVWSTMKNRVNRALDQFPVAYYAKLFREVKAIEISYADGLNVEELLKLKESDFPALLKQLAEKRLSHRKPCEFRKSQKWNFLTLNENTPRATLNV